jgi:hypothetical protein
VPELSVHGGAEVDRPHNPLGAKRLGELSGDRGGPALGQGGEPKAGGAGVCEVLYIAPMCADRVQTYRQTGATEAELSV